MVITANYGLKPYSREASEKTEEDEKNEDSDNQ